MRVAIACQGGGSHTAFTAGVLHRLLDPDAYEKFELSALSGTSGGAVCAALAWSGIVEGDPDLSQDRLTGFWQDSIYASPFEAIMMESWLWSLSFPYTLQISPYMMPELAHQTMTEHLQRWLPLERLTPEAIAQAPALLVGAADVLSGHRQVFTGDTLTHDQIIASAALPTLFRAVEDRYWDGLYTTNPPVREFLNVANKPEEIWVIRINPVTCDTIPTSVTAIEDRHNELAGNLSLAQELFVIQKINRLLAAYPVLHDRYRPVTVREIVLPLQLNSVSKMRRSRQHIESLFEIGRQSASEFIETMGKDAGESDYPALLESCS